MSVALVAGATNRPAQAAQGGVLDYAPGAPGPFVVLFPPIPGVFLLNQNFFLPTARPNGPDGKRLPVPVEASTVGSAERLVVSYPTTILGARFYQQLILPLVDVSTQAFGQKQSEFGVGNVIVSPFIFSWAVTPLQSFAAGLDIATGLGSYDKTRSLNVANNYVSYQPVMGYRYFDPTGFTFGMASRLLLNTPDDTAHYESGSAFATDFDVGYSLGKLRLGVVGGYAQQFTDDKRFGSRVPGGNRYRTLGLGPSLTYDFGPVTLNVNYQFGVLAENTVKSDTLWVNLAIPLYVPANPGADGPPGLPGSSRPLAALR